MDNTIPNSPNPPELERAVQLHEIPTKRTKHRGAIMAVGVGGMGSGFVRQTSDYCADQDNLPFILVAINTDADDAARGKNIREFIIGKSLTNCIGAGTDPEVGKEAFKESKEELKAFLEERKNDSENPLQLVVVVAGLGGGTGTGATPGFVALCDELKIPCFPCLLLPLNSEGNASWDHAIQAINEIQQHVPSTALYDNNQAITSHPDLSSEAITKDIREKIGATVKGFLDISLDVLERNADINDILTRLGYKLLPELSYTPGGMAVVYNYKGYSRPVEQSTHSKQTQPASSDLLVSSNEEQSADSKHSPNNNYDLLDDMLNEFKSNYCIPQHPTTASAFTYQLKYNEASSVTEGTKNIWLSFMRYKILEPNGDFSCKPAQGLDESLPEGVYSMTCLLAQFSNKKSPADFAQASREHWQKKQKETFAEMKAEWDAIPGFDQVDNLQAEEEEPTAPTQPHAKSAKSTSSKSIKPGTVLTFPQGDRSTRVAPQTTMGNLANAAAATTPTVECSVVPPAQDTLFSALPPKPQPLPTDPDMTAAPSATMDSDPQSDLPNPPLSVAEMTKEILDAHLPPENQPPQTPTHHSGGWDDLLQENDRLNSEL